MQQKFPQIYTDNFSYFTPNFVPGVRVYGERLLQVEGLTHQLRFWDPFRSKLAAALKNGWKNVPFVESQSVLYLGCAEGTTSSHVSDIVGTKGFVLGVDVSPTSMRRFIALCEQRTNMAPLLSDATKPQHYPATIQSLRFDVAVQDISQKNQIGIFLDHAYLLRPGGIGLLVIKARSTHISMSAFELIEGEKKRLEEKFKILETVSLEPFERHHALLVLEKK